MSPEATDGAPRPTWAARVASGIGALAALGAFGLWVWFAIENAGRVWERVSSFGPGPGRATKLEVAWLLVGWAVGPVFVLVGWSALVGGLGRLGHRLRGSRGDDVGPRA